MTATPVSAAQPTAHTEVAEHDGHHAEPTLLGLGAEGWVYVGVTIFFLLAIFVAKAPQEVLSEHRERLQRESQMIQLLKDAVGQIEIFVSERKQREHS